MNSSSLAELSLSDTPGVGTNGSTVFLLPEGTYSSAVPRVIILPAAATVSSLSRPVGAAGGFNGSANAFQAFFNLPKTVMGPFFFAFDFSFSASHMVNVVLGI